MTINIENGTISCPCCCGAESLRKSQHEHLSYVCNACGVHFSEAVFARHEHFEFNGITCRAANQGKIAVSLPISSVESIPFEELQTIEFDAEFWSNAKSVTFFREILKRLDLGKSIAVQVPLLLKKGDGSVKIPMEWKCAVGFHWEAFFCFAHSLGCRSIVRKTINSTFGASNTNQCVNMQVLSKRDRYSLSVVMPVYNEHGTFLETFHKVEKKLKSLSGFNYEFIIIESASTDGTDMLVKEIEGKDGVTVIWQTSPRGKGAAVREGLDRATGDIVFIQDADDEYDVKDYDQLIAHLTQLRGAFVLGARDTSDWRMRAFEGNSFSSFIYNVGHIIFTRYLNFLIGTKLKDPFTMYKVFFRDCLHNTSLVCNRFDFDHELVIKLVRKGFIPDELQVAYTSRSHDDGKKVSILKDAVFWVTTDLKLRFSKLEKN